MSITFPGSSPDGSDLPGTSDGPTAVRKPNGLRARAEAVPNRHKHGFRRSVAGSSPDTARRSCGDWLPDYRPIAFGELEDLGDCVLEGGVGAAGSAHWCGCVDCPHGCTGGQRSGNAGGWVFDDKGDRWDRRSALGPPEGNLRVRACRG
jgi:hypothetical protein